MTAATAALVPDFTMTREFDAPRSLVFEAWSKPEHLLRWWGRASYTMPHIEMDFRTGGRFRFCMRSTAGRVYWVKGVYYEIVRPERIAFAYALEYEQPNHEALLIATFEEQDGRTTLTLEQSLFLPAKPRAGAHDGWFEALDRLKN